MERDAAEAINDATADEAEAITAQLDESLEEWHSSLEDAEDEVVKPTALATAEGKGNLYLFADSDFLYDGAAYRNIPVGRGAFVQQPLSDNGPLVFNLLDQATNSKYLIGSRARTPNWRPFTVFQEMKAEAEEKTGREIEKIEEIKSHK